VPTDSGAWGDAGGRAHRKGNPGEDVKTIGLARRSQAGGMNHGLFEKNIKRGGSAVRAETERINVLRQVHTPRQKVQI